MLRRFAIGLLVVVTSLLAQDPAELFKKAPPDIDEALRTRVKQFYQYHVEGKFRAADALVAEDSKDIFFGADKPRCKSFEINNITYSDNFARAVVVILCDTEMMMPPVGLMPVKMPLRSQWKVVDGEWFWYVEPGPKTSPLAELFRTHGSSSAPPPLPPTGGSSAASPSLPGEPFGAPAAGGLATLPVTPMDLSTLQSAVKADRRELSFPLHSKASQEVTFTNTLPGSVKLQLEAIPIAGLEAQFDKTSLGRGESARLVVTYSPPENPAPASVTLGVRVFPTQQRIPIKIEIR